MNPSEELSRRLGFGPAQRLRRALRAAARRFRVGLWFPHVPLFLMSAALGVLMLRHALRAGVANVASLQALVEASRGAVDQMLRGAPSAVLGVFLVAMALGLLTRSRLAWVITSALIAASLALVLSTWPGGSGSHVDVLVYTGFLLVLVLSAGGAFDRSSLASATLFATISVALLLAYAVVGSFVLGRGFNPPIKNLVTALYYTVVTMSTVGYGDIAPRSDDARLFTISIIVLGITVFATSLSALLVPMISHRMERLINTRGKLMARRDHYVIVSDSALARNTRRELDARAQPTVTILPHERSGTEGGEDVIVGDPTDLSVLERAGVKDAHAILALSADDSDNAFIVMAARELSASVKTVAVVNDARNMARVQRVHPDLIIAPQVLGGELLAMALSGEKLESDHMIERLLHFST